MDLKQFIIECGIIAGAVGGIVTLVERFVFSKIKKAMKKQLKYALQALIFSDGVPLHLRVDAGKMYMENGWDGLAEAQHKLNVAALETETREREEKHK